MNNILKKSLNTIFTTSLVSTLCTTSTFATRDTSEINPPHSDDDISGFNNDNNQIDNFMNDEDILNDSMGVQVNSPAPSEIDVSSVHDENFGFSKQDLYIERVNSISVVDSVQKDYLRPNPAIIFVIQYIDNMLYIIPQLLNADEIRFFFAPGNIGGLSCFVPVIRFAQNLNFGFVPGTITLNNALENST
jgi:hypothetical protein